ncbi:DNA ligase IV [Heterostelium album PN500]|uniref:DNA ligase n=1 Tax=Heterostelium pallidum (strain ATCC 26659 / Pp 5 / PN500) TaxID=670386 RepID=D3B9H0_HETP5|nr:DNA ligase IV [Heterostelium album PN500]EFA81882.1 DNA ligase IV [Heterostelium album PN500]|eukprot:XP_020433999.1 DNA ligase IV [Heterostelium album PN500]
MLSLYYDDDEPVVKNSNNNVNVNKNTTTTTTSSTTAVKTNNNNVNRQSPIKNNNNKKSIVSSVALSLEYKDDDDEEEKEEEEEEEEENDINNNSRDQLLLNEYQQQQQQQQQQDNHNSNNNNNLMDEEELIPVDYEYQKTVPFHIFCELLDRLTQVTKHTDKKSLLTTFFNNYKDKDNLFPIIRLFLPQLDKDRQVYGLKEKTLAKFYVEMLGIAPNSIDAIRLINWKRSTTNEIGGDFGNAVFLSLKNRCLEKGRISIADINITLDQLIVTDDKREKQRLLKRLLRHTTATEQKWFVRIVLKEMKTGLSEKMILNFLHPDAMNLFNHTSSLRRVCQDIKGSGRPLDYDGKTILIGQPIKPMLADRKPLETVLNAIEEESFIVETKYDGERIQIHKQNDKIKLYSRNSNDCTHIYSKLLNPIIKECVTVENCIIDGELLVWDTIVQRYEEFGKLKTLALNQTVDNVGKQLCFIAFDVLYVGDKSVVELPLSQRYAILKRCISAKSHQFEVSEHRVCSSKQEIVQLLDAAILAREEGIMVKRLDSVYTPGERRDKWIKLKPEYLDGVGDDLDLVIVGGYYGSGVGRRGGTISHFILGVPELLEQQEGEEQQQKQLVTFKSFCKVGSGYTDSELRTLQERLTPHWQKRPLGNVQFGTERPDVYIDPTASFVLQIKAAQIVITEKYKVGFTLRFPRVVKIRDDKQWSECLDEAGVISLANEYEGRYAKRKIEIQDGKSTKKRRTSTTKKPKKKIGVLQCFEDTDTTGVVKQSGLFEGLEFCVVKGDRQHSKAMLEIVIVENGGTKVQYPSKKTNYVVSSMKEVLKIQNLISSGSFDIVHFQWLLDCIEGKRRIPLGPKYMIFTTEATRDIFSKEIDPYGDSFTEDTDVQTLKDAFKQIERQSQQQNKQLNNNMIYQAKQQQQLQLTLPTDKKNELFEYIESNYLIKEWWSLFRGLRFYLDRYQVVGEKSTIMESNTFELVKNQIIFYGGIITSDIDDNVQYVVIDPNNNSRLPFLKNRIHRLDNNSTTTEIVTVDWVDEQLRLNSPLLHKNTTQ